jgi:hypothetical protein
MWRRVLMSRGGNCFHAAKITELIESASEFTEWTELIYYIVRQKQ